MNVTYNFLKKTIDTVTEHIVVIDDKGAIQFANKSWIAFGDNNNCSVGGDWRGANYLEECDKAASMGDELGIKAGKGIRSVIKGKEDIFYLEYPCHSPEEKRWFMLRVTPFSIESSQYFVLSHQNITQRKLAEERAEDLARIDGLTSIPNRRSFDEFLQNELRRCRRLKKDLSLAIIDLDYFKLLNDSYGHQAGDACLVKIGRVLKEFVNRPGDLCARYGGEEFSIVWGDTSLEKANFLAKNLLDKIINLKIPNEKSPIQRNLTASIGLATLRPTKDSNEKEIIEKADRFLYQAKENGRCRIVSGQA